MQHVLRAFYLISEMFFLSFSVGSILDIYINSLYLFKNAKFREKEGGKNQIYATVLKIVIAKECGYNCSPLEKTRNDPNRYIFSL